MQVHLTRIDLVVVGGASADYARLLDDYERRLSRYVRLQVHEVRGEPLQRGDAAVVEAEGARVAAMLDKLERPPDTVIVALDREGESLTSESLAEQLLAIPHLVLVIGGAAGLAEAVLARARMKLAFGTATLPHQLARLVATEQLYRAFRIARGEPYHH